MLDNELTVLGFKHYGLMLGIPMIRNNSNKNVKVSK
jgi:hypothetical protein